MNRITACTLSLLLSLVLMTSAGAAEKKDKVTMTSQSKPIIVKKADAAFTIRMAANPTTGYSWLLKQYDSSLLTPLSQRYFPPEKMMPGAGGYEEWTFRIKPEGFAVPQVTKIVFSYARPWELKGGKSVTYKVVTNVN